MFSIISEAFWRIIWFRKVYVGEFWNELTRKQDRSVEQRPVSHLRNRSFYDILFYIMVPMLVKTNFRPFNLKQTSSFFHSNLKTRLIGIKLSKPYVDTSTWAQSNDCVNIACTCPSQGCSITKKGRNKSG